MPDTNQDSPSQDAQGQANGPSKIAAVLRPLAKEVIKGGLLTYTAVSDSLSGLGKQFNELLCEAKSELGKKEDSPDKNSSNDSSS